MKIQTTVTAADLIKRLGGAPIGITSLIASPEATGVEAQAVTQTKAQVIERIVELENSQKTCGSDSAYWGYGARISYLKAVADILSAAEIVGDGQLPDVPAPEFGGVLMDLMAQQERYGQLVLRAAQQLKVARAAHPGQPMGTKQVEVDFSQMREHGQPIIDAMKAMEAKGVDQHVAVGLLLYIAGVVTAQRAVVLVGDRPLQEACAPLWDGWKKGRKMLLDSQPKPPAH